MTTLRRPRHLAGCPCSRCDYRDHKALILTLQAARAHAVDELRKAEDVQDYGPLRLSFGASAAAGHWEYELGRISSRLEELGVAIA